MMYMVVEPIPEAFATGFLVFNTTVTQTTAQEKSLEQQTATLSRCGPGLSPGDLNNPNCNRKYWVGLESVAATN